MAMKTLFKIIVIIVKPIAIAVRFYLLFSEIKSRGYFMGWGELVGKVLEGRLVYTIKPPKFANWCL